MPGCIRAETVVYSLLRNFTLSITHSAGEDEILNANWGTLDDPWIEFRGL